MSSKQNNILQKTYSDNPLYRTTEELQRNGIHFCHVLHLNVTDTAHLISAEMRQALLESIRVT